jgi:cell division protein ZapD
MIRYEFPLNEKTRKLLRLEEIFLKADMQLASRMKHTGYDLFETLFDLMISASRSDLKVELIQELERQRGKFIQLKKTKKNLAQISELKKLRTMLEKSSIKSGFYFGVDKFLQEVKARSDSPFGILSTDFPEMQYYLQTQTPESRRLFFNEKFGIFLPIRKTIICLNNILRDQLIMEPQTIKFDRYEVKLDSRQKNDLVMLEIPKTAKLLPALSSNKYAININFNSFKKNSLNLDRKSIKFKLGVASF